MVGVSVCAGRRAGYRGAWSLLELLIAIAIMSLVVGLFIPAVYQLVKYIRSLGM